MASGVCIAVKPGNLRNVIVVHVVKVVLPQENRESAWRRVIHAVAQRSAICVAGGKALLGLLDSRAIAERRLDLVERAA